MCAWANNAIIAKAKSMYGNFLKASDYEKLVKYNNVQDVVAYLKKHPHYEDILKDVSEHSIHRGNLEVLVRKNAFKQMIRLIKAVYSKDAEYYELNIIKQESEIILSVLRAFISDDTEEQRGRIPYFFDVHTKLDIEKIIRAVNFDDLLEAISETEYYQILEPYYVKDRDDLRYLDIESALEVYYYEEAFKRIRKYYTGRLKRDLEEIYQTKIELSNIIKIYRLKKFYDADSETIKNVLIRKNGRLSERKIDEMIALDNPDELLSLLSKSEFKQFTNSQDYVYIEYYAGKIKYELAKKFIYFSTDVPKVYTAFTTLSEIEIENITNIVEGIRYEVGENEIKQMLIY